MCKLAIEPLLIECLRILSPTTVSTVTVFPEIISRPKLDWRLFFVPFVTKIESSASSAVVGGGPLTLIQSSYLRSRSRKNE